MKKYIAVFFLLFVFNFVSFVKSEEIVYPFDAIPVASSTDLDIKNLEWNRYTAGNIVVLSIDNNQGKWLWENIQKIRSWCLNRWGFPESDFSKECRIFCVPNKELLKKLFNLEKSKLEFREDISVLWLVIDDKPIKTLSPFLSRVCFKDFEEKNGVDLGWWFKCGASQLNGDIVDIKKNISSIEGNVFDAEKILTMKEEDYMKESTEKRIAFNREAIALCVMLRKEFGEAKLQGFLRLANINNYKDVLKIVYGFDGYEEFSVQYSRFIKDLISDLLENKTPDSYLKIVPVNLK